MVFLSQALAERADAIMNGDDVPGGADIRRGEDIFTGEAADYPRDWAGFIGQRRAKEELRVKIIEAQVTGNRLEHILLEAGEGGVGKTTLAHMIPYMLGVALVVTAAPIGPDEFYELVKDLDDRDCVFVDEVHLIVKGGQNKADWLLPWMLGGKIKTSMGLKSTPDVTLIAATTEAGKLPETLHGRFMTTPELEGYDLTTEAPLIVRNMATRLSVELDEQWWMPVARAADSNPRAIRKILTQVRALSRVPETAETHPNLERALAYAGRSADGLTKTAWNMLMVLALKSNRRASIATIGQELGEPGTLRHHEKLLLQRGLVEIHGQGRFLTDAGLQRVREDVKSRG